MLDKCGILKPTEEKFMEILYLKPGTKSSLLIIGHKYQPQYIQSHFNVLGQLNYLNNQYWWESKYNQAVKALPNVKELAWKPLHCSTM